MDRTIHVNGQQIEAPTLNDQEKNDREKVNQNNRPATHESIEISEKKENRMTLRRQAQPNILVKVQDYLFLFISHWKWFFISLAICLGFAYYQIKNTPNLYQRSAAIMIKTDESGSATDRALEELGMTHTPTNVNNQIMAITTSEVAGEVVRRLNLDVEYQRKGPFINTVAYGNEVPASVVFHNLEDTDGLSFHLQIKPGGKAIINQIVKNGEPTNNVIKLNVGQTIKTSIGIITIQPTESYNDMTDDEYLVFRNDIQSATNTVQSRLRAFLRSADTSIIDLTYNDSSPKRAEDILNSVVEVYNENWINDQNRMTVMTNQFIHERLKMLENELSDVEQRIAQYNADNLTPDIASIGATAYESLSSSESEGTTTDRQIYMVQYLMDYLSDGTNTDQLLPANMGITNGNIETQISDYNSTLLQRNSHLAHSSLQNPLVRDLDERLAVMKSSIIQTLENELTRLSAKKKDLASVYNQAVSQLSQNPAQILYINSVGRQRNVKEQLYLFLLQKREENELTQAFSAYNSRLIEPPHGSWEPISPTPSHTYMMALIFGFAIPAGLLVLKEGFNTVIRGRKDLEQLSVPFVGEIPLDNNSAKNNAKNDKLKKKRHKKGKHHYEPTPELVVMEKSRNVMNEAFRVVRSNLEFILGFDRKSNIVMVTSLNPGSGKTFITANLASSLGLNNRRVLAIDLDMRKGSLSKYVDRPTRGVSNYLSGQIPDYKSLIIQHDYIDILPCGTLPPNPSELLYSDNFKRMLEEVRREYDFVFLDCPPVEVVADSAIINRYSDMTLFVVRAQLMDRAFLPDLEHWYTEKRYRNLSVMLNGTTDAFSRYGYHKYGYRYGYHYGNYGYGYGNSSN